MDQGGIEDRDNAILRSDGTDIYSDFGVSMLSPRQLVRTVRQSKNQKGILLLEYVLWLKYGYHKERIYPKCTYDRMGRRQWRSKRLSVLQGSI